MSEIFLASVSWKSIPASVDQTARPLCVQTRDKQYILPASPARTAGHFHYSSL